MSVSDRSLTLDSRSLMRANWHVASRHMSGTENNIKHLCTYTRDKTVEYRRTTYSAVTVLPLLGISLWPCMMHVFNLWAFVPCIDRSRVMMVNCYCFTNRLIAHGAIRTQKKAQPLKFCIAIVYTQIILFGIGITVENCPGEKKTVAPRLLKSRWYVATILLSTIISGHALALAIDIASQPPTM
jgi:hypothetical protein